MNTVLPVKAAATSAENTSAAHDGQNKGKDDMEDYPDIDSDNDSRPSLYRLKKPNHFAKKLRNSEKAARKRLFPRPEEVRPRRNDTKKYLKVIIYEDYWLWKESVDGTHK